MSDALTVQIRQSTDNVIDSRKDTVAWMFDIQHGMHRLQDIQFMMCINISYQNHANNWYNVLVSHRSEFLHMFDGISNVAVQLQFLE